MDIRGKRSHAPGWSTSDGRYGRIRNMHPDRLKPQRRRNDDIFMRSIIGDIGKHRRFPDTPYSRHYVARGIIVDTTARAAIAITGVGILRLRMVLISTNAARSSRCSAGAGLHTGASRRSGNAYGRESSRTDIRSGNDIGREVVRRSFRAEANRIRHTR